MNALGLFGTSASLGSDKDHDLVSQIFLTIVLLLAMGLASRLPCTVRMLDIHFCGVCPSSMWYTKQILLSPYFCFSLAGTLSYLNPPSALRWLDPSFDIGFLLVARLPEEPLPVFETFVGAVDILSVVIVNS